jgi:hypothetical protein
MVAGLICLSGQGLAIRLLAEVREQGTGNREQGTGNRKKN